MGAVARAPPGEQLFAMVSRGPANAGDKSASHCGPGAGKRRSQLTFFFRYAQFVRRQFPYMISE
jgi:hypothetical protein